MAEKSVSIHAPVKGATDPVSDPRFLTIVSIHAPVKGATKNVRARAALTDGFNPRTREGCDPPPLHRSRDNN